MTVTFNIAPQPTWRFFYPNDWSDASLAFTPLVNGQIYTYSSLDRTPKSVYTSTTGMTAFPNPIILNANGEPDAGEGFNPIYWRLDPSNQTDLYYVEVRSPATSMSPLGTLIYSWDKYDGSELFPGGGNSGAPEERNFLSNPDFRFWSSGTIFAITTALSTLTADDWYLEKDQTTGTITVSQVVNSTSLTIPTFYPTPYGLNINITDFGTNAGIALSKRINDVYTLAGVITTVTVKAKVGAGAGTLLFNVIQNFGTGGSSPVTTPFTLTPTMNTGYQNLSATVTIPSIAGKTIGQYRDDYLKFQFLNTSQASINITLQEPQIQIGNIINNYQYASRFDETYMLLPTFLNFQTGWILHGQIFSSIPGWVILNDGTIGDATSNGSVRANTDCYNLFALLWNTFNEFICPIYDSTGLLIAKSTDADATTAWTANRAISVPRLASRVVGNTGVGVIDSIVTFSNSGGDLLGTLTSSGASLTGLIFTGTPISFLANGGTLPTGITASPHTYYAVPITSTTFKISDTSPANAAAGTVIAYTNPGSGTLHFHSGYLARSLGDLVGQESHWQLAGEVGAHTHIENLDNDGASPDIRHLITSTAAGSDSGIYIQPDATVTSVSKVNIYTDPNTQTSAFNVMQPTIFLNSFIKL